jgi:hypothetical protein
MQLFPPQIAIKDDEGFGKNDIFGRVEDGKRLTNLITTVSQPLVIAVDAAWGHGKTTFLKMWAGELRRLGYPVIYFDAFKNDYVEDAFTALAGEIVALAQQKEKANTPAARRFLETAITAGKILARSGLKVGVKAATVGALEVADFKEVASALSNETEGLADKYVGELITQSKKHQDAMESFRDALAKLPSLLSTAGENAETKPLVVIIDELDRCKPFFALEILERIKHFFSAPSVHFVLGTHLAQLNNSVVAAYGRDIDAHRYLQKFIHLTFHLIDAKEHEHEHERNIPKFIQYLVQAMEFPIEEKETIQEAALLIGQMAEGKSLSFRDIEQIFSVLAIALAFTPKNVMRPPAVLAGLCVMKIVAPALYVKAKRGRLDYNDVTAFFALEAKSGSQDEYRKEWFHKVWRYLCDPTPPQQIAREISEYLSRYFFRDRKNIIPFVANSVIDRMQQTG